MAKQHLQSMAEQITKKGHGSAPFHYGTTSNQAIEVSEDISTKVAEKDDSIKIRAYQIHEEKGGSDLDNWLEAERSLKNIDRAVSRIVNEGDPNIQK